jgi:hypothetical protein
MPTFRGNILNDVVNYSQQSGRRRVLLFPIKDVYQEAKNQRRKILKNGGAGSYSAELFFYILRFKEIKRKGCCSNE